jgi:hypothetical protein
MTELQDNPLRDLNNARNLPSDTPETDAMSITDDPLDYIAMIEKARKLERERDEARELAQQMSESNQVLLADVRFYRDAWEKLKASR